ncbi:DinB family protein [Aquimarina algiphila]|uniref:DinB family protein n=1 Tax=Aquimarina algiphila TaxID=2047982 RepID=UPI00232AB135|nr:hypothetical protein [Aquimarina algiphila]
MNILSSRKISQNWISFVQSIELKIERSTEFRLKALVKANVNSDESSAGLWVRIDREDGLTSFFDNMADRPIIENLWKSYSIEGAINKNSSTINFGGICRHSGTFCFKSFELHIKNENGVFEKTKIQNPNFENIKHHQSIKGWRQGTGRKEPIEIEEYTLHSIIDNKLNTSFLEINGKNIANIYVNYTNQEYSKNIGVLLSTIHNLDIRLRRAVQELTVEEIDYSPGLKINSIGASIIHLAAIETYYQVYTFENRGFDEKEKQNWQIALDLGEKTQKEYQGYKINYYLNVLKKVRTKTLVEFKKRTDQWLNKSPSDSIYNNHYHWLHVLEHYGYHIGQILLLKKLIPGEKTDN